MRAIIIASATLVLAALCAGPAGAAPLSYDCQARMTRVETIPPVAAGDASPWQCAAPIAKPGTATHWQRNSLEYCRLTLSAYDDALRSAQRMAKTHRRGQWIVLMDADETVLDNSLFERERQSCGSEFKDAQWESWVAAGMARDVPGAAAFTQAVHKLGGLIGIVTNRNSIPADPNGAWYTSGIRFGTPALTTRGFGHDEFDTVADLVHEVLSNTRPGTNKAGAPSKATYSVGDGVADRVRARSAEMLDKHPLYPGLELT